MQQSDDLTIPRIHYPAPYWQILPNPCDSRLNFATHAHPDHAIFVQMKRQGSTMPANMTHSTYPPDEQARHGIGPDLLRLSVGLESREDILRDICRGWPERVGSCGA